MIGSILNASAIIVGGVVGLTVTRQLSLANQTALKILLGAFTVYVGVSMTWQGLHGPLLQRLKQLTIVLLALILGNLTGKLLRIQKSLNRVGQYAKRKMTDEPTDSNRFNDGFIVCSLLFCVAPLSVLGALFDGLTANFMPLAVKAVMDGLATMAFVTTFRWSPILAAIPVFAFQGTITLLAKGLQAHLDQGPVLDSISATGGLLIFCVALIMLELKRIELADYLPSLVYAPVLTWLWR